MADSVPGVRNANSRALMKFKLAPWKNQRIVFYIDFNYISSQLELGVCGKTAKHENQQELHQEGFVYCTFVWKSHVAKKKWAISTA